MSRTRKGHDKDPRDAEALAPDSIPKLEDTAERVLFLARTMARGHYNSSLRAAIAEQWGLAVHTVSTIAAEASRSLRVAPEELGALREQHAQWADRIRREALETRNEVNGLPCFRESLEANRDAARFRGLDISSPLVEIHNASPSIHDDILARIGRLAQQAALDADQIPCPTCSGCPTCGGHGYIESRDNINGNGVPLLPPHEH